MAPPPVSAPHTATLVFLIVLAALAGVVGILVVGQSARERTLVPVLLMLGGVAALPIEPMWDGLCHFVFPFNTEPRLFTALGRPIPLYLAFVYPFFIGWGSDLAYRLIRGGASARAMLQFAGAFAVLDALIEIAGTQSHVWVYYGHQSFSLLGWPLYFGVLNGSIPVLGGAIAAAVVPRTSGWTRALALPTLVPTAYVAIYAVAGWPTWVALGSHVPRAVVWLAGGLTIVYCAAALRFVTGLVCAPAASGAGKQPATSWLRASVAPDPAAQA